MATGGVAVETGNRVTCSVCLEPYRGRHPKLLPCFHTFCLPCLTQLTSAEQQSGQVSPGEREETRRTLTCPTCRTTHPLPPGGIRGLQANFYVENINQADNADREVDPVSRTQQAGDLGDDFQAKVKDQLKVMEAVMSRLAEEEEELDRQKKVVELDIQERYDTGVRMLDECREECLVSLTEAAAQLTDKVQAEMYNARLSLASLHQLTQHRPPPVDTSAWNSQMTDTLLSRSALRHFRQLGSVRQQQPSLFSYTKTTNMAAVGDGLRQLMGSVAPSGGVPSQQRSDSGRDSKEEVSTEFLQLLTNASYAEVVKLRHDLTTLQTQLDTHSAQLQDGHLHLKENIQQLKTDNQRLEQDNQRPEQDIKQMKKDLESLKKEMTSLNDQLHPDMGSLREQVATDAGDLQKEVGKVTEGVKSLQTDMTAMQKDLAATTTTVTRLQNDTAAVQKDVTSLQADKTQAQQSQNKTDALVTQLSTQMGKFKTPVFFNAQLTKKAKFPIGTALILDKALTNTGGGYDATTGVFTAPVTATYLFIATASTSSAAKCMKDTTIHAVFDITVEGETVASVWCKGRTSCTAHAVVRLNAGKKVWLHASGVMSWCRARGDGYTSFCGVLVCPEL